MGTLFVVGDSRKVLASSRPAGFDPVRGYSRKERNLDDPRVREGIKEIAQMDGAIVVSADGVVEASCRYLDCSAADVTLSKGLGARHWAAAAISRATNAVAVTVSQSNGTVRIFQNGEVVLRIEPYLRRPMVWREFEYEPPAPKRSRSPKATARHSRHHVGVAVALPPLGQQYNCCPNNLRDVKWPCRRTSFAILAASCSVENPC